MKEIQRILSYVRRATADYDMIKEGDKVCVGVSAGKDSLTLLIALAELRRFYEKKFTLCAVTVDLGFPGADYSEISELCKRLCPPCGTPWKAAKCPTLSNHKPSKGEK